MQKIRVELSGLAPDAADRLMETLRSYLTNESGDIRLEVRNDDQCMLPLPAGGGRTLYVPYDNILYVTSDGHWCVLQLQTKALRVRINYSEIKRLLPGDRFLECNRGVLLAFRYIRNAEADHFFMSDGAALPIRRRGRREILLAWEQHRLTHNLSRS